MVQVIENWAQVSGVIARLAPSDHGPDWVDVVIADDHVEDVPGYPNLVQAAARPLHVRCRRQDAAGFCAGAPIRLRVRLGGPSDLLAGPVQ